VCSVAYFLGLFKTVSRTQEVKRRFPDGLPLLDPIEDMGIKDDGLKTVVRVSEAPYARGL